MEKYNNYAAELVKKLSERGLEITTAESCTGGMTASAITDIPGASKVFSYGFVVYSEEAKAGILGVSVSTMQQCGVVSIETAKQMASGAMQVSGADIAIGITGYAGPGENAGHICVCIMIFTQQFSYVLDFPSITRDEVRRKVTEFALKQTLELYAECIEKFDENEIQ